MTTQAGDLAQRIGEAVTGIIRQNELVGSAGECWLAQDLASFGSALASHHGADVAALAPLVLELADATDARGGYRGILLNGPPVSLRSDLIKDDISRWAQFAADADRRRLGA